MNRGPVFLGSVCVAAAVPAARGTLESITRLMARRNDDGFRCGIIRCHDEEQPYEEDSWLFLSFHGEI